MEFSSFRTWQWMIVGLIAGSAIGYAWSSLPNDIERTGDRNQFVNMVSRSNALANSPNKPAQPMIRNIVIKEPERDPSNVLVYPVTYEFQDRTSGRERLRQALERAKKGEKGPPPTPADNEPKYTATGIYAATPFVTPAKTYPTVADFLTQSKVSFTDRSGSGRYAPVYYGAASGFALIGVLWPATIQLLIKTGLAKAPPPREKKVKAKHRTGEDVDDMLVAPTAKAVDGAALGNLNDAMEANLAAGLKSGGPRAAAATAEEPVSVLMSGNAHRSAPPPDDQQAAPMTEQEKKDFAGQYYPVARTTKKEGDAH